MLERIVNIIPAFDKRDPDPAKNYGIGAVVIYMYLKGEKGVLQFTFSTGIYLPHLTHVKSQPMGYYVGYHSPHPMYEDQYKSEKCSFFQEGCYCDGSVLRADEWLEILIREGSDKIWQMLEQYYHDTFVTGET